MFSISKIGFDRADLRALGTMALGAGVTIPTAAWLLGGFDFGPHDWVPGLDLSALQRAGPMVALHIAAALAALGIGIHVLTKRKGGPRHRLTGRIWVAVMLGVAISGIAIDPFRFTPAHGAALLVFVTVPLAIHKVRSGDLRGHRRAIGQMLIALVIVGILALMPGQLLHEVFFAGA